MKWRKRKYPLRAIPRNGIEFRLETQIAQDPGNCLIPRLTGIGLSSDIAVPLYATIEVIQINYKLLLKVV